MPPYTWVFIGVFRDACLTEQIASGAIEAPGEYTVDPVPPGVCYVGAFMDLNHSENPDIGEPGGVYDPNHDGKPDPIVVSIGQTRTGVNFELEYQFQLSTISGTVTKNPDVTQSDTTYVVFFTSDPTQGQSGDPVDIRVIPSGTGAYVSSPLPFDCYYVICYMDINHNHELDMINNMPAEPVGLYGQIVQGQPVLTPVFLIENKVAVNMTLFHFTGYSPPFRIFARPGGASMSLNRSSKMSHEDGAPHSIFR
jgi:hypothetical protein